MTNESILQEEFEKIKQELIQKHEELGMKSSGKWVETIMSNVDVNSAKIKASVKGKQYTEQLIYGRKPGAFPPVKSIEQWIIDKGLVLEDNMTVSTLAFLIARKIAKEGTRYYKQGGTDLIESVVTPERIQKLINKVYVFNTDKVVTTITDYIKQMAI